jgi:hypothetical protein
MIFKTISKKIYFVVLFALAMSFWTSIRLSHGVLASPQASPGFDSKILRKEFKEAQDSQLKMFEMREKKLADQFNAMQANRQKDFETTERAARRKYFEDPHPGPEKRNYMHDLIDRREQLKKRLTDERNQFQSDAETRLENLLEKQQKKRVGFAAALKKGERPDDSLWPQPNMPVSQAASPVEAPSTHAGQ